MNHNAENEMGSEKRPAVDALNPQESETADRQGLHQIRVTLLRAILNRVLSGELQPLTNQVRPPGPTTPSHSDNPETACVPAQLPASQPPVIAGSPPPPPKPTFNSSPMQRSLAARTPGLETRGPSRDPPPLRHRTSAHRNTH